MSKGFFYNNYPKEGLLLQRVERTNMFRLVNSDKRYGLLLENITSNKISGFRNIDINTIKKVSHSETGQILNNCLIITPNEKIDKNTFIKVFEEFLIDNKKDFISSVDIAKMLSRLSELTKKIYDDQNKIIGVWGELHFIDSLILSEQSEQLKSYIINSWESEGRKSLHDFTFTLSQNIIEVKTTILNDRSHHIFDYEQVVTGNSSYNGHLLSLCINKDELGLSNSDLVSSIRSKLSPTLDDELETKLEIKGDLAKNDSLKFVLNKEIGKGLFPFEKVPRPGLAQGVSSLSWRILLEENDSLSDKQSVSLINEIIEGH